jgi:hypothetical protein
MKLIGLLQSVPSKGTLDNELVSRVFKVIMGNVGVCVCVCVCVCVFLVHAIPTSTGV